MNININRARGEAIIDEMAKCGYELYAHEAQVLVRPLAGATQKDLPGDLRSWPNHRGSVLIALRARATAQQAVVTEAAPIVEPTTPVINKPGFGDGGSDLADDPIIKGADFGTGS
jgi:hypothetical protein